MDLLECRANARFLATQLRTSLRAAAALRGTFLAEMLFMALNNLVFFTFWWALFLRVPEVRGHRLSDVALLFGLVAASYGLYMVVAGGGAELGRLILDGELDAYLTHPKPVLFAVLGSRSNPSGLGDLLSGLALITIFGQISVVQLPCLLLAIIVSTVVLTGTVTLFWSCTFFFGQIRTLVRLAFEMLLSFSLYPKGLFGGVIKGLMFTVIPAAYVGHLPAAVVTSRSVPLALALVAAASLYWATACWFFERGLQRYSSGNRFGMLG